MPAQCRHIHIAHSSEITVFVGSLCTSGQPTSCEAMPAPAFKSIDQRKHGRPACRRWRPPPGQAGADDRLIIPATCSCNTHTYVHAHDQACVFASQPMLLSPISVVWHPTNNIGRHRSLCIQAMFSTHHLTLHQPTCTVVQHCGGWVCHI